MSMEINRKYGQYPADYVRRLEEEQEKMKETEKGQNCEKTKTLDKRFDLHDEYISSEESGVKPSGLYRLGQDEDGRKKVFFDDSGKAGRQPEANSDNPEKSAEKITGNTDAVDREIEKLKKEKQQLEQQIKAISQNEEKTRELEKKLAQVEAELSQKDNDTYRRQHTVISE